MSTLVTVVWPPNSQGVIQTDVLNYVGGGRWYCPTRKVSGYSSDGSTTNNDEVYFTTEEILNSFPLDSQTRLNVMSPEYAEPLFNLPVFIIDALLKLRAKLQDAFGSFPAWLFAISALILAWYLFKVVRYFGLFKSKKK